MKHIMFNLNEKGEKINIIELNGKQVCDISDKCESICKRHFWKDGWICEKCGLRRYDYDQRKNGL